MGALSVLEAQAYVTSLQARTLVVGLFTDKNTEVSGGGYARQPMSLSNGVLQVGVGVRTSNLNDLSFGPASTDWAAPPNQITWIKVIDSVANRIVWAGEIPTSAKMSVVNGQPYEIRAGALGLTLPVYE